MFLCQIALFFDESGLREDMSEGDIVGLIAGEGRLPAAKDRPQYYVLEERNSSVLIADEDRKNVVAESVEE